MIHYIKEFFKPLTYCFWFSILFAVFAGITHDYVESKIREVKTTIDQSLDRAANLPTEMVGNSFSGVQRSAKNFNQSMNTVVENAGLLDETNAVLGGICNVIDFVFGSGD